MAGVDRQGFKAAISANPPRPRSSGGPLSLLANRVIPVIPYVGRLILSVPRQSEQIMDQTAAPATDAARAALLRQYAKGEVTWHELCARGFDDYVEVLAGLGELGLRPPIAPLEG